MQAEYIDTDNGREIGTDILLKPYGTLMYQWGKCASYDLGDNPGHLRRVKIKSPVEVDVIFHNKDQSSIPKELSTRLRFDGTHHIEVTVEKTIDVNQNKKKPCYKPEENHGETYGKHDYMLLNKKIVGRFNCTTPFIPSEFRNGAEICLNKSAGILIHQFLKYSSASFSTNMWNKNYHSIPPCIYHTYTTQETKIEGKVSANIIYAKS